MLRSSRCHRFLSHSSSMAGVRHSSGSLSIVALLQGGSEISRASVSVTSNPTRRTGNAHSSISVLAAPSRSIRIAGMTLLRTPNAVHHTTLRRHVTATSPPLVWSSPLPFTQQQVRCIRIKSSSSSSASSNPKDNHDSQEKPSSSASGGDSKEGGASTAGGSSSTLNTPVMSRSSRFLQRNSWASTIVVGVIAVGSVMLIRTATFTVTASRAMALEGDPSMLLLSMFMSLIAVAAFIFGIAMVTVNERRNAVQEQMRSRARRRCLDVRDVDDWDERVLGKHPHNKSSSSSSPSSSPSPDDIKLPKLSSLRSGEFDTICRVNGVLALDVGQFDDADDPSAVLTPSAARNHHRRHVRGNPAVIDEAIGVAFDVQKDKRYHSPSSSSTSSSSSSSAANYYNVVSARQRQIIDTAAKKLSRLVRGGSPTTTATATTTTDSIGSAISDLSSEEFLDFIVDGTAFSSSSSAAAAAPSGSDAAVDGGELSAAGTTVMTHVLGNRVLALERTVEMYQFAESVTATPYTSQHNGGSHSSNENNNKHYQYTAGWHQTEQTFANPASYRVVVKTALQDVDPSTGAHVTKEAYVPYVFNSASDSSTVPFPYPQVRLNGSVLSTLADPAPLLAPNGLFQNAVSAVANVVTNAADHRDAKGHLPSSLSLGVTTVVPKKALKLWLRPSSKATHDQNQNQQEQQQGSSSSTPHTAVLRTIAVQPEIVPKCSTWQQLSFKDVTPEGIAAIEDKLMPRRKDGQGKEGGERNAMQQQPTVTNATASTPVVSVLTSYVRPSESSVLWLFKRYTALLPNKVVHDVESIANMLADPKQQQQSLHDGNANANTNNPLVRLLAEGNNLSNASNYAAINKALAEAQRKDIAAAAVGTNNENANNGGYIGRNNTIVKNWTDSESPVTAEMLRIPSRRLRISPCGGYLTTVHQHEGDDGAATAAAAVPRIGDVRVSYRYIPARSLTLVGMVKDGGDGRGGGTGLISGNQLWGALRGGVTNKNNRSAGPAAAGGGATANFNLRVSTVHMPYAFKAWTHDDYLTELQRTGRLRNNSKDSYRLAFDGAAMPSSGAAVKDWMIARTKGKIGQAADGVSHTIAQHRGGGGGDDGEGSAFGLTAEEVAETENLRFNVEAKFDGVLEELGLLKTPFVPNWAMDMAEQNLAHRTPIEVICGSSRENASTGYLFRKHWWRDECTTWRERYFGFLALQISLAVSTSLVIPIPAGILGVGCSIAAGVVWAQAVLIAKADLRRKALLEGADDEAHEARREQISRG